MALSSSEKSSAAKRHSHLSQDLASSIPWVLGSKALLIVVGIGVPLILVRSLGPAGLGAIALCRVVSEFLLLICGLGLGTAILRFVPEMALNKNASGIVRLLAKSALLQFTVFAFAAAVLVIFRAHLASLFRTDVESIAVLALLLTFATLTRETASNVLLALFRGRAVAALSVCQGFLWLFLLLVFVPRFPSVSTAVGVQAAAIFVTAAASMFILFSWAKDSASSMPGPGIGKRRVLYVAFPSVTNGLAGMLLRQHTEIFFLGAFAAEAAVGYYELGCGIPLLAITFLPMTLHGLFTAGYAQAYARDPSCLGTLIEAYYRFLILAILPLSVFGIFFASDAVPLIYGVVMAPAGPLAAFFCGFHTLTLIGIPLSLALVTKEKVLDALPLLLLQVAVNIPLDFILIPRWEVAGAAGAVLGTWILTIPIRLYVVGRLIGGIFFPLKFFLKMLAVLVPVNAVLYLLATPESLWSLFLVTVAYMVIAPSAIRLLGIVRPHEFSELRAMDYQWLNRVLDFLSARSNR